MSSHVHIRHAIKMLLHGARAATRHAVGAVADGATVSVPRMVRRLLPSSLCDAAEAFRKQYLVLANGRGIQGLGVAYRTADGGRTKELALKVYVDRKLSKREAADQPIPKVLRLKSWGIEIRTDVEPIGLLRRQLVNRERRRPAFPGLSVFNAENTHAAGTFGCLVRTLAKGTLCVLSNAHVLAQDGTAHVGDAIEQPAPKDQQAAAAGADHTIARLLSWSAFQLEDSPVLNTVDAAIARVTDPSSVSAQIPGTPRFPKGGSLFLRKSMTVQKWGRSSGHTTGVITDTDFVTCPMPCLTPGGGTAMIRFYDQVLCTKFTDDGDSGAAVLDEDGYVVGLHFAGSENTSIFNKLSHIEKTLGVKIEPAR